MKSDDDHDYDDDNHIDDNDDYNYYHNDDNHETKTKSMITTTTMSRMGLMKTIKIGERSFSKATSITNVGQVWAPNSQFPEGKTGWIRPDIRSERRSILVFLSIFLQGTWTSGILKMLRWANSSVVNLWWKSKIIHNWMEMAEKGYNCEIQFHTLLDPSETFWERSPLFLHFFNPVLRVPSSSSSHAID